MPSLCSHCKQNIEPMTYHELINDPELGECRVKDQNNGMYLYNTKKGSSGWGKE